VITRKRWRPVVPLGVPHATSKADVYDGYDIPKGTTVFANIEYVSFSGHLRAQLMSRLHSVLVKDPTLFEGPEKFDPSRFLIPHKPAGNWNGRVDSDFTIPFGFGRRICPGMHVALQSTFICMARCVPRTTILLLRLMDFRPVITNCESTGQDFLGVRPASRGRWRSHRSHKDVKPWTNARTCALPDPRARASP
jgi:hypothetical protein